MNRKSDKRARPGRESLTGFRPSPLLRAAIVRWAEHQADAPTLAEAMRRLIELGLTAKGNSRASRGRGPRAREMAGNAIDDMIDAAVDAKDKASRKQHLLDGPEEFRRVRIDRPRPKARPFKAQRAKRG